MIKIISNVFQNRSIQFLQLWNYSKSANRSSKLSENKSFNSFREALDYIESEKVAVKNKVGSKRKQKNTDCNPNGILKNGEVKLPSVNAASESVIEDGIKSGNESDDGAHKITNFSYDVRESDRVRVYTDGSCKMLAQANRTIRRAGIGVYWRQNSSLNVSEKYDGIQTNNRAEIAAATRAVRIAIEHGVRKLTVVTDSEFLIKCMTCWLDQWKCNGWLLPSTKKPVVCRDELMRLDDVLTQSQIDIKWEHMAGHSGDLGNHQADLLATAGADKWLVESEQQQKK